MAYDDIIRVADEKTQGDRVQRIRAEMGDLKVTHITEYTHPRAEELVTLLPAPMGRYMRARPRLMAWVDRRVNKGRRLRSDKVGPFLQLWLIAGLRGWRRGSLRHQDETVWIENWLETVMKYAADNRPLAVESLKARRLIKGYSDTSARGSHKFDRVMRGIELVSQRDDAAQWARRLIAAALEDEKGDSLDGALQTIESFA